MPSESSRSATISWPTRTREDILASIRSALPELREKLPAVRVVLFGSYATGRATVASDAVRRLLLPSDQGVDLLVVYKGPARDDAFATLKTTIPVRGLEPHVYTIDEAAAQRGLLTRMTRDSVVIYEDDD